MLVALHNMQRPATGMAGGDIVQASWRQEGTCYTLGSPDPRSFSRGKRGIAGSLIFAVFNRDALLQALVEDKENWQTFAPPTMFTAAGNLINRVDDRTNALEMSEWNKKANEASEENKKNPPTEGSDLKTYKAINVPSGFGLIKPGNILYIDTVPPFDIMMTFANEYGQAAFQKIYDAEILNEGSGVNVDTIVMERQMTFIARRISPIISGVYAGDGTLNPKEIIEK